MEETILQESIQESHNIFLGFTTTLRTAERALKLRKLKEEKVIPMSEILDQEEEREKGLKRNLMTSEEKEVNEEGTRSAKGKSTKLRRR